MSRGKPPAGEGPVGVRGDPAAGDRLNAGQKLHLLIQTGSCAPVEAVICTGFTQFWVQSWVLALFPSMLQLGRCLAS